MSDHTFLEEMKPFREEDALLPTLTGEDFFARLYTYHTNDKGEKKPYEFLFTPLGQGWLYRWWKEGKNHE